VVRVPFEANAVPQLQVKKPPDSIVVVAIICSMFAKELLHSGLPEKSAVRGARFEKQALDAVELWARQPTAPGGGKS
jgi:hypothetical protein